MEETYDTMKGMLTKFDGMIVPVVTGFIGMINLNIEFSNAYF